MKIATFNCNSIRSRLDVILSWMEKHRPDVLCLQETKVQDSEFPAAPIRAAGYHVVYRGEKAYNGVALISRSEPSDVGFGLDGGPFDSAQGGPRDETRLLCAKVGRVTIVNTYVPQGREVDHAMYKYKLLWFKRLRSYFDHHFKTSDLLLWAGDMNVAAEPIDVHNPEERENHVCFHKAARRAFAHCRSWGFVDVFRKHHPEPGQYTFCDYRMPRAAERGLGWRIDYLLASPALAKKSENAFIDLEPRLGKKPSDHTFLAAEFSL
ncbi:MAG: exodeoxyribonuclease III [Verrucomicrobiota bacterium]